MTRRSTRRIASRSLLTRILTGRMVLFSGPTRPASSMTARWSTRGRGPHDLAAADGGPASSVAQVGASTSTGTACGRYARKCQRSVGRSSLLFPSARFDTPPARVRPGASTFSEISVTETNERSGHHCRANSTSIDSRWPGSFRASRFPPNEISSSRRMC